MQSTGGSTSQHLRLVGSTALLPLAARAGDLFHQQHPDIQVNVAGGGSVTGLQAVTNHQADIGDSDIYADPVTYPDPNLTDHIICVVAFTLIVDPQITIPSLTSQQILAIFTGKVTNWKAVGGPDQAITTVIRPNTSGTRALFRKYILGGAEESGKPLTSDSSTGVLDEVAHTPGAIGYVTTSLLNSTVRAIGIDGVSATEQNIKNGKYKFWGYEHMYTLANGVSPITSFLDFMQTAEIQHLAQQLGYISVNGLEAQASIPSSVKEQNTR
ncbi:MAG TPA: phosphate ABC transporter substrate-binding protein [Ktedonobacteraceae bacterium]|nr:phosphate ABC transporter substrate-binding protein [Ktedonobacteraceae bacterium]